MPILFKSYAKSQELQSVNLIVFSILQVTHPVPYCFRPNVVLFKSHAKNFKVWILLFFSSLHSISLVWCLLRNLFSFNFWAGLSSKNVGGKSCCSSLECSLASESATRISWKCDQFTHAMSDFYDYCNPDSLYLISKQWYIVFFFFFPKYLWKHKTK